MFERDGLEVGDDVGVDRVDDGVEVRLEDVQGFELREEATNELERMDDDCIDEGQGEVGGGGEDEDDVDEEKGTSQFRFLCRRRMTVSSIKR